LTAYTSTQSGKFGTNSTWVGGAGHPSVNGDTFTIAVGHDVEMDQDTSGLTTGFGASTINGTLHFSRTAGTYYLKMNAILTVSTTGTLDWSDGAGGVYPSTCTATLFQNATATLVSVAGNGVVTMRCAAPTHTYCKLTAQANAGATVLSVDTDLTGGGDALWANNNLVRVDNINQAAQSEQQTISSVTSNSITLQVGLTNTKLLGSYVILASRNAKMIGNSQSAGSTAVSIATNAVLNGEIRNFNVAVNGGQGCSVNAAITNVVNGFTAGGQAHTFTGVLSSATTAGFNGGNECTIGGLISGCAVGVTLGISHYISAIITGCGVGIQSCGGHVFAGQVINSTTGMNVGSVVTFRNAIFSNNTQDLTSIASAQAFNSTFSSATPFLLYTDTRRQVNDYVESISDGNVVGAFRAWCKGGVVTNVASPVYDATRARSYKHAPEDANNYVFMQQVERVPAGASLNVRCYVQKDASMSYLPRLWIYNASKEPLISGSPDVEVIMTNSLNTWEVLTATITNNTNGPQFYYIRTLAKNASGNVYFDPIVRVTEMYFAASQQGQMVV
jgi:hypothetical protein